MVSPYLSGRSTILIVGRT